MRSGIKRFGLPVVLVAAAIAGGGYAWNLWQDRFWQSTNDATLQADQIAISAREAGNIGAVLVTDNQLVPAGAPLVRIDPIDFRIRLAGAEAGLAGAEAARTTAAAALAEAKAGIASATADQAAARATLDHAAREVARYRPLVEQGAEPAQVLAQWTQQRDAAQAALAARTAALEAARQRAGSLEAQIGEATARSRSAEVQRQSAARDLALTEVTAPVAGRVAARAVRLGQYVQPGVRLLTIVPSDDLYVTANFKETQVGLMRPGQRAVIHVDALSGIEFPGRVISVTPGTGAQFSLIPPQNATGNFTKIVQRVPVKIALEAGPTARRVLAPGMSVTVEVDTGPAREDLDRIAAEQRRAK